MSRALLALLAACGGSHPPPHDPPNLASGESDPAVASDGNGGGLTPELVSAVGSRPLVIEELASLRLNAAERLRAQQAIAAWATASGLTILPPDRVEQAISRAAEGLDPTGKSCGPALDRAYAMERWIGPMGAKGKITARVDCSDACTIQVEIHLDGLGTEFFGAPFDPAQPWEAELKRRLSQVRDNGGHERYGHANNPVAVKGVARRQDASDWYLEDSVYAQRKLDAEIFQCGVADMPTALLLEPDGKGGIRCERASTGVYVTEYAAKVTACMCALAIKREKPTARSFFLYESAARIERPHTKNGKEISATVIGGNEYRPEGTAPWFFRDSDSIEHCFVARTDDVEAVEANATLEFDANGAVAKATIGDLAGIFRPDERACITQKLMTIRSPCPSSPPLAGTARLSLHIHKPYGEK